MVINYVETLSGGNFLADIGKYSDIFNYLAAVMSDNVKFTPVEIELNYRGEYIKLREAGENKENWKTEVLALHIPKESRRLPNDSMEIEVDGIEQELVIHLY